MSTLLDFTKPHVLRNVAEYNAAVEEIDQLLDLDPAPATETYERLEFLSVLIQAYEDTHLPFDASSTPQDLVDFMLEQKGLSRTDLAEWMGGKSRVSEFFSGIRPLSLGQVKALKDHLGIPADLLIGKHTIDG
jgi:HTH-type transcriptional regulator/antitoxin HigA